MILLLLVLASITLVSGADYDGKPIKAVRAFVAKEQPGKSALFVRFTQQYYSGAPVKVSILEAFFPNDGGEKAIHVHRWGNLTNDCKSVGGHFNPDKVQHGGPNDYARHVGDLGNFKTVKNVQNFDRVDFYDYRISLFGRNSIIGRSLVVHQKADDFGKGGTKASKINGNSGQPVVCGIIVREAPELFEMPPTSKPVAKSDDVSVNFGKLAHPVQFGNGNGHYVARMIMPRTGGGYGYGYGRH